MADTGRTVFADGFFADDFWAAGFWSTQGAQPQPESVAITPAGKKKRRRYFVQIDGQDFEVASAEQARQVLQRAVALAEKAAERQIKPAPLSLKVKPVAVAAPQIATNAPLDLEPYQRAIEAAYAKVAQIEELRRLFEAQARQDDDDAAAMLLLH